MTFSVTTAIFNMVISLEIIGIVCEYNPFHNGHIHHIQEIKKKYPDSLIILALNGYFLERGEISILSKDDKTRIALENNVDLVIEIPVLYGSQSADNFAYAAVYLLNKLKVNKIIFGSETNDISKIIKIAKESNSKAYAKEIKDLLETGLNYPTALAKSLKTEFSFMPNDLLGISYVKAIMKINKKIIPETIQRTNSYLDTTSDDDIISASNIRNKLKNKENIKKYLPKNAYNRIININYEMYFNLLKAIIIRSDDLDTILDVDEGIENRIKEMIYKAKDVDDLVKKIKTRRYTYNKINRMLIHILLGIKKKDAKIPINYLRVIGLNINGRNYLKMIRKDLDISLNTDKNSKLYEYEMKAAFIYDIITGQECTKKELSNKPIIY